MQVVQWYPSITEAIGNQHFVLIARYPNSGAFNIFPVGVACVVGLLSITWLHFQSFPLLAGSSRVSAIQGLLKYWSEWEDSQNFQHCPWYCVCLLLRGSTVQYNSIYCPLGLPRAIFIPADHLAIYTQVT